MRVYHVYVWKDRCKAACHTFLSSFSVIIRLHVWCGIMSGNFSATYLDIMSIHLHRSLYILPHCISLIMLSLILALSVRRLDCSNILFCWNFWSLFHYFICSELTPCTVCLIHFNLGLPPLFPLTLLCHQLNQPFLAQCLFKKLDSSIYYKPPQPLYPVISSTS